MHAARPTILLVDDGPAEGAPVHGVLAEAGYEVVLARDADSGLVQARHERPALVVIALRVPKPDGWEASRRLKADPLTARIPVVVVADRADRRRVQASACDAWHTRPVAPERLLASVAELLARSR